MDFSGRKIDFREADRRYAELKRQLDTGTISTEEFEAHRRRLMVQDDEGRWWAKSRNTGEWNYHDGSAWVRGTPPGYQSPRTTPAESATARRSQPVQDAQQSPSQTPPPGSVPTQDQNNKKQRLEAPRRGIMVPGLLAALVIVVVGGVVAWMLMGGLAGEGEFSRKEGSEAAPGYALLNHDSGAISVEVPSEWDERVVVDQEGEKGRSSWSSFSNTDESVGPSMTAVNDLANWRTGTREHQGIYMVASKNLAQGYTIDELVTSGPNDYSSSCEAGTPQDFERPPYSGKMLEWNNCGGDSDHAAVTLAAAPESRECVVAAQIGGLPRVDEESVQHILDTLEVNCSSID